jgi:hypothetical protein
MVDNDYLNWGTKTIGMKPLPNNYKESRTKNIKKNTTKTIDLL